MNGSQRVIVGVSGSARNLPALRQAATEARKRDAVLLAVHAWTPPDGGFGGFGEFGYSDPWLTDPWLTEAWTTVAWQRLRAAFETAFGGLPPHIKVDTAIVRGGPGPALVAMATREDDLLVIGTGRRGVLRRLSHAHVARYCATRARCGVLVIPPPELAREMGHPLRARLNIRRALSEELAPGARTTG